ncbi:MAG: hypothetical protein HQL25_04785, partial [Candidatus Omnitrophica bacterium]|nr:hypothetical protein [Candidatus Omnitrophota bacterium]
MRKLCLLVLVVVGLCMVSSVLYAQTAPVQNAVVAPQEETMAATDNTDTAGQDAMDENLGFAFGNLKSVSATDIVVTEQDDVSGQTTDTACVIDKETSYEGVDSIAGLKQGDVVEVVYQEVDGKKIVKMISKADMTTEEEPAAKVEPDAQPAPVAK